MSANPFETSNDPIARKVVTGLAKIGIVSRHLAWRQAVSQTLTPTQGQILSLLRTQHAGIARPSDLASDLGLTLATVSDSVRVLSEKALVSKKRSRGDGREIVVRLTAAGRRAANRYAGWSDYLLEAVGELSPSEQKVFLRVMIRMIRSLQQRGQIPVARMCVSCRYFRPNVYDDAARPHHCTLVDAAFGDQHLRLDCPEQEPAESDEMEKLWALSVGGGIGL